MTPESPVAPRYAPQRAARRALPVLAALGLVAACGGGTTTGTASSQTTTVASSYTVVATDNKFDGTAYSVGKTFALEYRNRGTVTHSMVVKDSTGKIVSQRILLGPGRVSGFQTTLAPGAYKLVCDVPGHEGTMHAELKVA